MDSFAQAVCACLTDPPTEIKAETIVKAILEDGKNYRPTSEWLSAFVALKE